LLISNPIKYCYAKTRLINNKLAILLIPILIIFALVSFWIYSHRLILQSKSNLIFANKKILSLSKSGNSSITVVFVGDSMTEYLGNFDELRGYLKNYYPEKKFLLLNYGFSSTNILSVQERLEKDSTHSGRIFQAINDIPFDLILIESFGHNPLSQYSLNDGLKKQQEALDKIVETISKKHRKSSIIFVSTIAPNKDYYGLGAVNLTPEQRQQWVSERIAYIKNHIQYANSHNILLINIYEKSLDDKGTGNIDYVSSNDFIHPSPTGVYFISEQIVKYLYENNRL